MLGNKFKVLLAGVVLLGVSSAALAVDGSSLPKRKQTTLGLYLTPKEAYDMVTKDPGHILFVDIRTRAEVNFLGMPTIADANIPYMKLSEWYGWDKKKSGFKMELNDEFLAKIRARLADKGLTKNDKIVFMCRSGDRSAAATNLLAKDGYTNVYSVVSGFEGDKAKDGPQKGMRAVNGWKNDGLPWTYKLVASKMYITAE
jgi:rhodanese-related sulfurtransferase